jgi:hypothetical protein
VCCGRGCLWPLRPQDSESNRAAALGRLQEHSPPALMSSCCIGSRGDEGQEMGKDPVPPPPLIVSLDGCQQHLIGQIVPSHQLGNIATVPNASDRNKPKLGRSLPRFYIPHVVPCPPPYPTSNMPGVRAPGLCLPRRAPAVGRIGDVLAKRLSLGIAAGHAPCNPRQGG